MRQVQAPAPQSLGKIASDHLHDVWFADLIDFSQTPSAGGEKYILIVQDVFSRRILTRSLMTKRPKEVAEAFEVILREAAVDPNELVVDKGSEFLGEFKTAVELVDIKLKTKTSLREISILDSAIGKFKKALVRDLRKAQTDDWVSRLDKVTKGQNKIPNKEYLDNNAPESVEGDQALQKELEDKNREFNQINRKRIEEREAQLYSAGYFRVMLNRPMSFARGFKPNWSDKVHKVTNIYWDEVTDSEGNKFKTKFVLPVSGPGQDLPPSRIEAARPAQVEDRKQRVLNELSVEVRRWLGSRTVSLKEIRNFLSNRNFRALALEARLNMRSPVINFLKAFPDVFQIRGSTVHVIASQPAFQGARRLRRRL